MATVSIAHRTGRAADIVSAARDAFAEHGYHGASISDIAGRVGVVAGAIYKHFASKREILTEVVRAFYEPLIASAAEGAAAIESPTERLRYLVSVDVHAITSVRAVAPLLHLDAFHQAFGTRPGDAMWRAPEQRVVIW